MHCQSLGLFGSLLCGTHWDPSFHGCILIMALHCLITVRCARMCQLIGRVQLLWGNLLWQNWNFLLIQYPCVYLVFTQARECFFAWNNFIYAHVRDTLLCRCNLLVVQLSSQMLTKCSDVNLLLGILSAVSTFHVTECNHGLIIHVNVKRLKGKWCIVAWFSGIILCIGVHHFLSIFRCNSVHGSILDVGVDTTCGIGQGRCWNRVKWASETL